jgi:hypothetical protein
LGTASGQREQTGLIGSVQRALRVLEIVAAAGDGVTAKVVARRSGYKLSTTYHLLNTLVHEGYLVRLPNARGFGLGYKLTGLHERLCSELDVVPSVFEALKEMHTTVRAPCTTPCSATARWWSPPSPIRPSTRARSRSTSASTRRRTRRRSAR